MNTCDQGGRMAEPEMGGPVNNESAAASTPTHPELQNELRVSSECVVLSPLLCKSVCACVVIDHIRSQLLSSGFD